MEKREKYGLIEAKADIKDKTKDCTKQALRKGSPEEIPNIIEDAQDEVLDTLSNQGLEKEEFDKISSKLSSYCERLIREYKQEYQDIINSEGCQTVIRFFKKQEYSKKAIGILLSHDIITMLMVEALSQDEKLMKTIKDEFQKEFKNSLYSTTLEKSLSDSKIQTFRKDDQDELKKQKDERKLEERMKKAAEAIQEVDELRQKVQKSNQEQLANNKAEVERGLGMVNLKLGAFRMNLNLPTLDRITELKEQLNNQMADLSQIKQGLENKPLDFPPTVLFQKNGVFNGFLFSRNGNVKQKQTLITLSPDVIYDVEELDKFFQNPPPFQIKSRDFSSAEKFEQAQAWTEMGGRQWGATLNGNATNLLVTGSVNAQHANGNSSEESKLETGGSSKFTYIQTRYIFYGKSLFSIPPNKLRLSESALESLKKISNTTQPERDSLLEGFFSTYGSHVMTGGTLGGYYELQGKVNEVTSQTKNQVHNAVFQKLQTDISAGLKFISPLLCGTAGGSFSHESDKGEGTRREFSSEQTKSEILSEVFVLGGDSHVSIPQWVNSLEFNRSWRIIERDLENITPVWKLLANHKNDFTEEEQQRLTLLLQLFFKEQIWELEEAKVKPQSDQIKSIIKEKPDEQIRMREKERETVKSHPLILKLREQYEQQQKLMGATPDKIEERTWFRK